MRKAKTTPTMFFSISMLQGKEGLSCHLQSGRIRQQYLGYKFCKAEAETMCYLRQHLRNAWRSEHCGLREELRDLDKMKDEPILVRPGRLVIFHHDLLVESAI